VAGPRVRSDNRVLRHSTWASAMAANTMVDKMASAVPPARSVGVSGRSAASSAPEGS
jgi:hypothetical protein